jgi:hypothetical protein
MDSGLALRAPRNDRRSVDTSGAALKTDEIKRLE